MIDVGGVTSHAPGDFSNPRKVPTIVTIPGLTKVPASGKVWGFGFRDLGLGDLGL